MEAFSDPKVKGVTLYLSDFSRPVADKLMNGDIFSGESCCRSTSSYDDCFCKAAETREESDLK